MGFARMRTSVAVGVSALLVATTVQGAQGATGASAPTWTVPGPELESAWEAGLAGNVLDGDTLMVSIQTSSSRYTGTQRVRTIGINAPEVDHGSQPEQCGSAQAESALRTLAPVGTPLQLRALDSTSYDAARGRVVRSIYAQDGEGNWFDTARQLVSDGRALWFPHRTTLDDNPEWAHNLEYRVLADDARAGGRGLWSKNYCGTSPAASLRLSVSWDQSVDGHEKVFVFNDAASAISLSRWTLRDSALNLYRFPSNAVVPARGSIELRMTNGTDDPAKGIFYAGDDKWFDNLPADNPQFAGDAAYLMDDAGRYQTGNLRAWFPYPCNPDDCRDPLVGALAVVPPEDGDWNTGQEPPSAPRQVDVEAGADGSLGVTWLAPASVGNEAGVIEYRVKADGPGPNASRDVPARKNTTTLTGLTPGTRYTVTVAARNAAGWSDPSPATGPVTAHTAPEPPTGVLGVARDGAIAARWAPPASDNGAPITRYTASATEGGGGSAGTCTTFAAEQSCVIGGLANGTGYRVTVAATNRAGTSVQSAPSKRVSPVAPAPDPVPLEDPAPGAGEPPADPPAPPAPSAPIEASATALDGAVVAAWTPGAAVEGAPISGFVATATSVGGSATCQATSTGPTSCVIAGLANGTTYQLTVRALAGDVPSPESEPVSVTPTAEARVPAAAGVPTPASPAWAPRETIRIRNVSGATVDLTGYGLWDKNPRSATDTPDHVFPRGTTIAAGQTLRVRSGDPTTYLPASATLHYTGRTAKFTASGDRIELANMNKALVDCEAWGGVSCRGQRPAAVSTQPVGITARISGTSLTVNWGAPISRGGTAITGYTATAYDAANGGRAVGTCSATGSARSCTIPRLPLGGRFYAEVVARNAIGVSAPSAPRVLGAPRTAPSAPGGVSVAGGAGSVNVRWSAAVANGATVTSYTAAAYTTATGGTPVARCTTTGTALACTIPGLSKGTPYFIDVTATNRAGTGAATSPRRGAAPAGAPSAQSTYSKKRVTVRWDRPAPGSAVTGYVARLYTKSSGGSLVGQCTASATATSCRTKKLKKRTSYYIDLTTVTANGSFTVRPRIKTGPPRKAYAPKVLSAAADSARKVVITWRPTTFNGYSTLKSYKARLYKKSKGGSSKATCYAGPTSITCTTKTMKKGKYYAAARVKNSQGWSKWSKRVKVYVS